MILNLKNKNIAKRKFIDEYLVKDSSTANRVKYWTDIGYSSVSAYQLICECNKQFAGEYKDCVSGVFTKDKIISMLNDILDRNIGKNDKLVASTLESISNLLGYNKQQVDNNVKIEFVETDLTAPIPNDS